MQEHFKDSHCDVKNCFCDNDITPAGVMISHVHDKTEWMVSYRYMQMDMSGMVKGTRKLSNSEVFQQYDVAGNAMNMKMHMLMLMYGLNGRLTFMGMVNYNSNYMEMTMNTSDHQHDHAMKTSGFGDLRFSALYAVVKKKESQLIINGGINIPMGSVCLKGNVFDMMYPNTRLPYMMQLGSGTWDALPGITYIQNKERCSYSAQLNSTLRFHNNHIGYRYGNEYSTSVWYAYSWLPFLSISARIEGAFIERIKSKDVTLFLYKEPAANPANYGGVFITSYFGFAINFKKDVLRQFRLGLEYGAPMYQNFNGIQMSPRKSIIINTSFKF